MKDLRKEERFSVAHFLDLGYAEGITRDFSTSGMYVETDIPNVPYTLGSKISPRMRLDCPWGEMIVKCNGEIVRVEPRDGGVGLAVKIIEFEMELDS
jgi:hypothetical protein